MSGQGFAKHAKKAPPTQIGLHGYTCHVAGMYWMFREQGETEANANIKVDRLAKSTCQGCIAKHHVHLSLKHEWYGRNMCRGAKSIPGQADLIA